LNESGDNMAMTSKGFLAKLINPKNKASAKGFLAAYREYLVTGEVSSKTRTIIGAYSAGDIDANTCFDQVAKAVFEHVKLTDEEKAKKSQERTSQKKDNSENVTFMALIFDAKTGNVATRVKDNGETEDLEKTFELPQDAERWCDRRLFDGSPSWYGEIWHFGKLWSIVERADSIARTLKRPKMPSLKPHKKTTSKLGFGVKVHG
jgi:hypothetical protein